MSFSPPSKFWHSSCNIFEVWYNIKEVSDVSKNAIGRLCAVISVLCLLLCLVGCRRSEAATGLSVEVLDVGQSDCTLLRQGDAVWMIDAATTTERGSVIGALYDRRIERIDCLVLTHPHEDHIGNARMLLENYEVGTLIVSPCSTDDLTYRLVLETAEQQGVSCHVASAEEIYTLGGAVVEILLADASAAEPNDASVVLRVTYGNTAFLFTGDAELDGETALLATAAAEKLDCDFLKAGHHGSDTSCCEALLQAVTPTHVAISCGKNNEYGFPHQALLQRLDAIGATYHRTDEQGTLRYVSDGEEIHFLNENALH